MKGFRKHIVASVAITAVFVVCALAIVFAGVPATSPAKNIEGTGSVAYESLLSMLVPEGEAVTAADEAPAALPAPAAAQAELVPVAVVPVPSPPAEAPVEAPEVTPTDPPVAQPVPQPAAPPTPEPAPVLNPPRDLVGTFVPGDPPCVQLVWDPNNNGKVSFNVYRLVVGEPGQGNVPPIAHTKKPQYADYDIKPGLTYRYWVTAVSKSGEESGPSNLVEVKTYSPEPPAAPKGVQAWVVDPGVSFDWLPDGEGNLAGYNLYEPKGASGKWRKINQTPVTDNHYYYAGGEKDVTYAVSAVNFYGVESEYVKVVPVASAPVVHEEDDPSIGVEGVWVTEAYEGPSNGKIRVAGDAGSRLHFRFTGSQVKMIVATYWTCGSANVYLDGELAGTVNLYSYNPTYNVVDVDLPGIKRVEHVLTVEVLGTGNPEGTYNFVNVDAFEVR